MKQAFILLLLLTGINAAMMAQQKNTGTKPAVKPAAKAPKLKTYLNGYADSVKVKADIANYIISGALKVSDETNTPYTVTYYKFYHKKLAVGLNEKTGKASPEYSYAYEDFTTTPIPEKWLKLLKEQIQAGEELLFFNITVKDKQGRVYYAPNVKINIVK